MLSAAEENAYALSLLGLSSEDALETLQTRVRVTSSAAGSQFAADLQEVLRRTLQVVGHDEPADIEVAVGCMPSREAPSQLAITVGPQRMMVAKPGMTAPTYEPLPGLARKIGACFAAGRIIAHATGGPALTDADDPFIVEFDRLGLREELLSRAVRLENAALVGAGGVANGFVWGLLELNVTGDLTIVDPKSVSDGNLNRCLFFDKGDIGLPKAERLAANAKIPGLKLVPRAIAFGDYVKEVPRIELAISTVDSRRVRRTIQSAMPWAVVDASTTGISEVVVHSHKQPTTGACLGCIYPHIPQEGQRERDIAQGLGIDVDDLKAGFVSSEVAIKIVQKHPDLDPKLLTGKSFDTLFKERCAEDALLTGGGEQVFAPFAFISNLAGLLLALELALQFNEAGWSKESHYMTLDPWRPPHQRLRRVRGRSPHCKACSDLILQEFKRDLWADRLAGET